MKKLLIPAVILLMCAVSCSKWVFCAADETPPKIVATVPADGDTAVDPGLAELSVTFDEPMKDKNWSWCYENPETFPKMTGDPRYEDGFKKCVLPVQLEPDKEYVIWFNMAEYKNFKDCAGNPLEPVRISFKTAP